MNPDNVNEHHIQCMEFYLMEYLDQLFRDGIDLHCRPHLAQGDLLEFAKKNYKIKITFISYSMISY